MSVMVRLSGRALNIHKVVRVSALLQPTQHPSLLQPVPSFPTSRSKQNRMRYEPNNLTYSISGQAASANHVDHTRKTPLFSRGLGRGFRGRGKGAALAPFLVPLGGVKGRQPLASPAREEKQDYITRHRQVPGPLPFLVPLARGLRGRVAPLPSREGKRLKANAAPTGTK